MKDNKNAPKGLGALLNKIDTLIAIFLTILIYIFGRGII